MPGIHGRSRGPSDVASQTVMAVPMYLLYEGDKRP